MNRTTLNVLIIDDDITDAKIVTAFLKRVKNTRYQIEHQFNLDSLTSIKSLGIDIILLDYYLGNAQGIDLIRKIRSVEKHIPIIVITGADSNAIDEIVMTAGAADYLPKDELSSSLLDRTIKHALDRKAYLEKLEYLANRDPLTKLANRAFFEEHLNRTIAFAKRHKHMFAVLLLDLDRFKEVNDTLGHNVGDFLLNIVAIRLKSLIREEDLVARLGGDEFIILLSKIDHIDSITAICNKILNRFSELIPINDSTLSVSTSIGVAVYPDNSDSAMGLMQKADIALYKAKENGKNTFQFFDEAMRSRLNFETNVEAEMRNDIGGDNFYLVYQPQINIKENRIVGFEALVRWHNPKLGSLPPTEFIPIAEKTGLIVALSDWITEQACSQLHRWNQLGFCDIHLAINLSPKQLRQTNFINKLHALIEKLELDPANIELEVTESSFIDLTKHNIEYFKKLKNLGVNIALDDFGTGYSSLSYLQHFPINKLKIDRSFLIDASRNKQANILVQSITFIGRGLGIEVIAEGVESSEQEALLKQMQCDLAQGFFYSRPIPAEQATLLMDKATGVVNED